MRRIRVRPLNLTPLWQQQSKHFSDDQTIDCGACTLILSVSLVFYVSPCAQCSKDPYHTQHPLYTQITHPCKKNKTTTTTQSSRFSGLSAAVWITAGFRAQVLWLRRDTACRFTYDNIRRTNSSKASLYTRRDHLKHCDVLSLHITAVLQRSTGRRGFSCLSAVRFNLTTKLLCHSEVGHIPKDTQEGLNPDLSCTVQYNGHLILAKFLHRYISESPFQAFTICLIMVLEKKVLACRFEWMKNAVQQQNGNNIPTQCTR